MSAADSTVARTVDNTKARFERIRIQWRAAMLASGRVDELRELARSVKWQEKLTYDPTRTP